jgi:PelA/Pel-15E family pectate lyase
MYCSFLRPTGYATLMLMALTTHVRAQAVAPHQTLRPIRILLVGDSTVTDDSGWGRGFKARLSDRVTCLNVARNGRSSRSYIDEGHWNAALAAGADYVLIQFGHNDQPGKGPERETDAATTYRDFLGRYVDEARAAGMTPVIVTSLTRRKFDAQGLIASDLGSYAEAAAAVALARDVPLIDLHALSIDLLNRLGPERSGGFGPLTAEYSYDTTHLSELGSEVFGDLVVTGLVRVVPGLAPYVLPRGLTWGECMGQPQEWYGRADALRIADNVLLYQRSTGGWPKNQDMARVLDDAARVQLRADKAQTDSTIDNGSTTTQMRFLARVIQATGEARFRASFLDGFDYLIAAQYANGGWPQFFPLRTDYSRHITFNDNAMVNTLRILRDVAAGEASYLFVDTGRRRKAADAVAKGIDVILRTQVTVDGRLTIWAAQHDAVTLRPQSARTYEPAALSASESVAVVEFLMESPAPTRAIIAAVDAAAAWFDIARLSGFRTESRHDPASPRGWDRVVVADPAAPSIWARFYEIGTNRPLFLDRDGVVKYRLDQIGYERRTGYAWYGTWPAELLEKKYPAWK